MKGESNVEKAILRDLASGADTALIRRVSRENQIILHNFQRPITKKHSCQLIGCCRPFSIVLIPNQVIYPKYCDQHRTEHRRAQFLGASPPTGLGEV